MRANRAKKLAILKLEWSNIVKIGTNLCKKLKWSNMRFIWSRKYTQVLVLAPKTVAPGPVPTLPLNGIYPWACVYKIISQNEK